MYRVPLPLPNDALRAVNVYLVTDGERMVVVDAGWALPESRVLLGEAVAEIGAGLGDITEFLITHAHRDHYTMATTVRREFGCRITLGAGERPNLAAMHAHRADRLAPQIPLLRRAGATPVLDVLVPLLDRAPEVDLVDWAEPDEWLEPGPRTVLPGRVFEVVPTPGHTAGHVVFDDAEAGLMFSGDHVLPHITPSIAFEAVVPELPLRDYLDSLALVRARPDRRMLPAHGPVTDSVHTRVDELLDHHAQRLDLMGGHVAAGADTAYAVAERTRWTRREKQLAELDALNQMLAVLETAAHLDLLVHRGKLTASDVDGVDDADGVRHYALG